MDSLLREFLAEAEDLIEALFRDIEALREKDMPARTRRELTGRVFRHVHTLKGTAAAASLTVVSQTAHEFETLLDGVRAGRVTLDDAVLDAFDDATHALSQTLDAAARGDAPSTPLQLLQRLRSLTQSGGEDLQHPFHPAATAALLPEEIAHTLGADETRRVHEAVAEGQSLFVIHLTLDLETFDQSFRELSAQLGQRGELVSTLPGLVEAAPGALSLRLLYASDAGTEELSALANAFGSASIEELKPETLSQKEKAPDESDEEIRDDADEPAIAPLPTQVRVELGQLDELISATHELMAETVAAFALALERVATEDEGRDVAEALMANIQERFIRLEEQLIGLRRVALARTLERAARAGAQAARAIGKEVAFEIRGGEVRLDKSLVEAINDPLVHLVRNAVDHGIETPDERERAGKRRQGLVRLEAAAENDCVILKITDDGCGIDLETVARAAVRQGIIEEGQSVSRHQALRLIFRPSFSTAAAVSEMSGRGVGLDVVERAIEQVGGEMRVWSEAERGTTFEMIMPVALALMRARVVSSDGFSYCVDARLITETCEVKAEDVRHETGGEVIERDGMTMPLVRLRKLLGQPEVEDGAENRAVVVLSMALKKEKEAGE
ncbi:MAG: Hpt domain-containing protein [Pyrinomonadaceae bacterium]|nr:Hpt domain-containing protein [Pyrinomonadaceae bacterium]